MAAGLFSIRTALGRGRRSLWTVRLLPFFSYDTILHEKWQRKKRAVFGSTLS